jgi:preprotein translocase subunit SecY
LPGSIFLALIAIFPYLIASYMNVSYNLASFFGGTSLLIVVGVALDLLQQLQTQLTERHYKGFMTGGGRIRGRRYA